MSQELEIEFKNLLTSDEFNKLKRYFLVEDHDYFEQKNSYFDTQSLWLRKNNSALRIREKNNQYILTLKQATHEGMLETHHPLTESEAIQFIEKPELPPGQIQEILEDLCRNDHASLQLLGELTTYRAETPYKNGLIVLDHSLYLGQDDYELEYEVPDFEEGKANFFSLLEEFNIPKRKTQNKIARLFEAIQTRKKDE